MDRPGESKDDGIDQKYMNSTTEKNALFDYSKRLERFLNGFQYLYSVTLYEHLINSHSLTRAGKLNICAANYNLE